MDPVEEFMAARPYYRRDDVLHIAALRRAAGTPFCRECHDWHDPEEDHSLPD